MDPAELPDDDYPLVLNTGRLQHQWHTMTKTGKVAKLNKLNPGPFVEIHPDDAAALGIADGRPVELDVAARPRGAARRGHRPGAARQLLRAVPLERRARRVPDRQRRHQRRRRPGFAAAGVQGVRGAAASRCRVESSGPDVAGAESRTEFTDDEKSTWPGSSPVSAAAPPGVPVLPARRRSRTRSGCGSTACWPGATPV